MIRASGNGSPPRAETLSRTIPQFPMIQLNNPFEDVSGGDCCLYSIRVDVEANGAGALAYVSAVDTATNDAFFVRGTKRLRPDD